MIRKYFSAENLKKFLRFSYLIDGYVIQFMDDSSSKLHLNLNHRQNIYQFFNKTNFLMRGGLKKQFK